MTNDKRHHGHDEEGKRGQGHDRHEHDDQHPPPHAPPPSPPAPEPPASLPPPPPLAPEPPKDLPPQKTLCPLTGYIHFDGCPAVVVIRADHANVLLHGGAIAGHTLDSLLRQVDDPAVELLQRARPWAEVKM